MGNIELKKIVVDSEIVLIPYYPNEEITFQWYQDKDVCKQVDNRDDVYSYELLNAMYSYLSTHGECYYIQYNGVLVGDITLEDNTEIAIVVCKEYQNRHIGRTCVKAIIDRAKEKEFGVVKAKIYSFNKQSQRTFKSLGFQQVEPELYELVVG